MAVKRRHTKKSTARPRTFEEVHAANLADPFHAARIGRLSSGERFDDATAASDDPLVREVSVHPDCEGGSHWLVEWGDSDGGCLRDDVRWADGRTAGARFLRRAQGRTADGVTRDHPGNGAHSQMRHGGRHAADHRGGAKGGRCAELEALKAAVLFGPKHVAHYKVGQRIPIDVAEGHTDSRVTRISATHRLKIGIVEDGWGLRIEVGDHVHAP
jgi:hypothetical protein